MPLVPGWSSCTVDTLDNSPHQPPFYSILFPSYHYLVINYAVTLLHPIPLLSAYHPIHIYSVTDNGNVFCLLAMSFVFRLGRFSNWYRQHIEDRKRLKYLHDLCNEYDSTNYQTDTSDTTMEEERQQVDHQAIHSDEGEEDEWFVNGGIQGDRMDVSLVQTQQAHDQDNHSGSSIVGDGSCDDNIVSNSHIDGGSGGDDDNDWSIHGGIVSSNTPHLPLHDQPLHQTSHDQPLHQPSHDQPLHQTSHDQSFNDTQLLLHDSTSESTNFSITPPANSITSSQSNDELPTSYTPTPTPTSPTLPQSSQIAHTPSQIVPPTPSPTLLVPSLQSLAWRQWGKNIDWGKVRGQGSDIYSRAQGNPTISTTSSTPSSVTTTPRRVISVLRPSVHSSATGQGLVSQPRNDNGSSILTTHSTVQSNSAVVSLNHTITSSPALAVAVALVPVRQSPLLSAAASSIFATPTLAHLATKALHNYQKLPEYSSLSPRSRHSSNNNNNIDNNLTKQSLTPPQPQQPQPHHHQLQPHQTHLHVAKLPQELEEERLWISSVLKRARDQVHPFTKIICSLYRPWMHC